MPTSRSYEDACGIARALDVLGERWALLVVRELLLGPQRYSDLRRALRRASSNILADRLRELEARGVVGRRKLPPPAASTVYELTDWGRRLEPVVLALGAWGLQVPQPRAPSLSAVSVLLFLRGRVLPASAERTAIYRVELDERVWTVREAAGELRVEPGEPPAYDAAVRTDPTTLYDLLGRPSGLDGAIANGDVVVSGDIPTLQRLLEAAPA